MGMMRQEETDSSPPFLPHEDTMQPDSHLNDSTTVSPVPAVRPACKAVSRRVDLDPVDWFLATWRNLKPLPRPEPGPFDLDAARLSLGEVKGTTYDPAWNWDAVSAPVAMTRPEAHFWFRAMTANTRKDRPAQLATRTRPETCYGNLTLAEIEEALWGETPPDQEKKKNVARRPSTTQPAVLPFVPGKILLPLVTLLGTEQAVAVLLRFGKCQRS